MIIKIEPDERHRLLVNSYWMIEQEVSEFHNCPMFPCGYPVIEFNLGENWTLTQQGTAYKGFRNWLIGVTNHPVSLVSQHKIKSVIIRLTPWALPIMGNQGSNGNAVFSLDSVFGNVISETEERLRYVSSNEAVKYILDDFVDKTLMRNQSEIDKRIIFSINYILKKNGNINVTKLTQELNIGQKRLEQLFKIKIGCSPKEYAEVTKVNYALNLLKSCRILTHLSLDAGYYDQSHFIRVCKKMSGLTPSALSKYLKKYKGALTSNLYNY